jgi:hypothetical protein
MSLPRWIIASVAMNLVAACEGPEFRGTAALAPPGRVPRIAAGSMLEMTIQSQLERRLDNGSLTPQASSGPHFESVEAWVVMASVEPTVVAEARPLPGTERNLGLTGLTAGTATVSIRGVVSGQWSELTFGIEVVDAGALAYEIFTDQSQAALLYRGGEVATLARGYCYERVVQLFDEHGVSLEYAWPSWIFLAPTKQREYSCGVDGIIGSTLGHYALPTIGKAKAVEAEFVDPTFQVRWNPIARAPSDPERGISYRAELVATDAKGQRIAMPSHFELQRTVETPAACELVAGYVVHRSPREECRVIVTVPGGSGEPSLALNSRLPQVSPRGAEAAP